MKLNMKKTIFLALLASVFCTGLFAQTAEVISAKGKVEVSRGNEWVSLKVGDKVSQSETISTGFQSEAKIKMGDSILQLGALSRVTIATLATGENKEVVDVYLNTGAVRSKVTHTSDNKKINYTVRNPIAVASVRGTDFSFTDNGTANCAEGAIALAPTSYYDSSQLSSGKSADDVTSPADGKSDASTPATDIAPDSPRGSIVVLAGQVAVISANGNITTPLVAAINNVTKPASTVSTAANSESISISLIPTTPVTTTYVSTAEPESEQKPQEPATTTGEITITIDYE